MLNFFRDYHAAARRNVKGLVQADRMSLDIVAPAFLEMAHRIVWCNVATVDRHNRPRSRVLHPLWIWEEGKLTGWICTEPTEVKKAHLEHSPYLSCSYWSATHDTCTAECRASWSDDRARVWDLFVNAPAPVGYTPSIVPTWPNPEAPRFGVLKLEPWRLRVFPGEVLLGKMDPSAVLSWHAVKDLSGAGG